MKQDGRWFPVSPLGWALGFSCTVMLFASAYTSDKPASLNIATVKPKITTVTVRTVTQSSSPFVSQAVCIEALRPSRSYAPRIEHSSGSTGVSPYHCQRIAENASLEMVNTPSDPRFEETKAKLAWGEEQGRAQ